MGLRSQLYPFGTSEQFPNVVDSDNSILDDSAHAYAECSNVGICDRTFGICTCFSGYEGANCGRTVCPNTQGVVCNGHGTCESAEYFAKNVYYGNNYDLWDSQVSQGCLCDPGYYGISCDYRYCKYDYDPLFWNEHFSPRYSNWSIVIGTTSPATLVGNYSLIFYDVYGEDWVTEPIPYGTSCKTLVSILESLPNKVIPANSVRCLYFPTYQGLSARDDPIAASSNFYGIKYTLAFPQNPGILKQPKFSRYLDGNRPTLNSNETISTLQMNIFPNGFHGEFTDYFDICHGVDVNLKYTSSYTYLSGLTPAEERLLQMCLGDADGLSTSSASYRVEGVSYSWDYGTIYNPHLIKLIDITSNPITDLCPGSSSSIRGHGIACSISEPPGFFAMLYYSSTLNRYILFNNPSLDYSSTTDFAIYTTTGTVQMVSEQSRVLTHPVQLYSNTIYTINSTSLYPGYNGNVDCETISSNVNGIMTCLSVGDRIFFMDPSLSSTAVTQNPRYFNLYTVRRLYRNPVSTSFHSSLSNNIDYRSSYQYRIDLDMSVNFQATSTASTSYPIRIFKFTPPTGHLYVSECSNRGLCLTASGICSCFTGFESDACSVENNIIS